MAYIGQRLHEVKAWDGNSEALPPTDDVLFRITEVKQELSSKKQTQQLVLSLEVVGGSSQELVGRKTFARYGIGDGIKEGQRGRLRALVDAAQVPLDQQGGFNDEALVGRVFLADLKLNSYTQTDPVTGASVTKENTQVVNERPAQGGQPQMQMQMPQGFAPPQAQGFAPPPPPQVAPGMPAPMMGQPVQAPAYPVPGNPGWAGAPAMQAPAPVQWQQPQGQAPNVGPAPGNPLRPVGS